MRLFNLCRLLKALRAPKKARIFWAGVNSFGGKEALLPLCREFPLLYNKEDLALLGELDKICKKTLFMTAIYYIVFENSDIFMPFMVETWPDGHTIQVINSIKFHVYVIQFSLTEIVLQFEKCINFLLGDKKYFPRTKENFCNISC